MIGREPTRPRQADQLLRTIIVRPSQEDDEPEYHDGDRDCYQPNASEPPRADLTILGVRLLRRPWEPLPVPFPSGREQNSVLMEELASRHDQCWRTGPTSDRGRYRVDCPTPLPGGEGFVFRASGPGGAVALKLLGAVDDERLELLQGRWRRVLSDPHPNLARPIELFRGPGLFSGGQEPPPEDSDLLYAATVWADGESLRAVAPLPVTAVARMAVDVAAALAHLHDRCGLVYRDLHPGNVIVHEQGGATLIDLGAIRPDDGAHTVTIAGTLGFIAPERIHEPGDRRADAWALGMLVVFAVLGHPKGRQTDAELRSQLEEALAGASDPQRTITLIESMLAADPDRRPPDVTEWAAQLRDALCGDNAPVARRRRTTVSTVVGTTVLIATAVVLAVQALGGGRAADDSPDESSTGRATTCSAADFPNAAVAAAAGGSCPVGPPFTFGDAVVQPVQGSRGEEAIVSSSFGSVVLTAAQLASYREIAGRQRPQNAITFGGYPVSVTEDGGVHAIELSVSGLIVGERPDTQSFWMPGPVVELWRHHGGAHGDLGMPMTNPYFVDEGLMQDFARGKVLLPADIPPFTQVSPSALVVTIDDSPGSGLAGLPLDGRLIRQPTGTAWYVEAGRRRWVPTGEEYQCLGGDDAVVVDNVAGSDVATLALGEPMTCDE